jgi:dTDP-4-amino-4,6-dideoxygalactose transaminase
MEFFPDMLQKGDLDLNTIIEKIQNEEFFSFAKINHGFWENMRDWQIVSKQGVTAEQFDAHRRPYLIMTGFFTELLEDLRNIDLKDSQLLFAASPLAYKDSREREGTPLEYTQTMDLMHSILPKEAPIYDGLFWKTSMLDGSLRLFFEQIKHLKVLLVGPSHLQNFDQTFVLDDFSFLEIHPRDARKERQSIEQQIRDFREQHEGPLLILFQAATLAPWLIFRLHRQLKQTWMIDMGRALDICSPHVIKNQNWFKIHAANVIRIWRDTNPEWDKLLTPHQIGSEPPGPLRFIQDKTPAADQVATLLKAPAQANHWTNFGPLSQQFEERLHQMLQLPAEKAVVACNSATTALFALVGLQNFIHDRRLRWVTSAYGFFTTGVGAFSDVTFVDCDETGMLNMKQLEALDLESFDGVVVTNLFGAAGDLKPYADFCKKHEKQLIVDNAYGLDIGNRDSYINEAISFHHTKPWGFGEGGVAITHRDHATTVRSLINFGVGLPNAAKPYAMNGKLSEVSTAYILARLDQMPYWSPQYRLQYRRIVLAAAELGLRPLLPTNVLGQPINGLGRRGMLGKAFATPAHVPLMAHRPICMKQLNKLPLPLKKYYLPLTDRSKAPTAHYIYDHMVNVPCHPDIRHFSVDDLYALLRNLQGSH